MTKALGGELVNQALIYFNQYSDQGTRRRASESGFESQQRQEIFLHDFKNDTSPQLASYPMDTGEFLPWVKRQWKNQS
jgi:hypothetical protein